MRIGIPAIISEKCFKGLNFKKGEDLLIYKNENEFINNIIKLKNEKKLSRRISNNCYNKIKKSYKWEAVLKNYYNLI